MLFISFESVVNMDEKKAIPVENMFLQSFDRLRHRKKKNLFYPFLSTQMQRIAALLHFAVNFNRSTEWHFYFYSKYAHIFRCFLNTILTFFYQQVHKMPKSFSL